MPSDTVHAAMMKPFAATLAAIDRGRLCDKAAVQLAELTEAVAKHERPGTITVKLTVKPRKGEQGTVDVEAVSTVRLPEPPHTGVFFITEDHQLSRDDPTMDPLFTRDAAQGGAR